MPRRAASPERLTLLRVALEVLDRADGARALLDREGLTTTTKTTEAVHVHPAVKVEREALALFIRAWSKLNLNWSYDLDA